MLQTVCKSIFEYKATNKKYILFLIIYIQKSLVYLIELHNVSTIWKCVNYTVLVSSNCATFRHWFSRKQISNKCQAWNINRQYCDSILTISMIHIHRSFSYILSTHHTYNSGYHIEVLFRIKRSEMKYKEIKEVRYYKTI